jgi:hypothetical protein
MEERYNCQWKYTDVLCPIENRERSVFCDVTLCSPLKVNRRFGGTCYICLPAHRIPLKQLYIHPEARRESGLLLKRRRDQFNKPWNRNGSKSLIPIGGHIHFCRFSTAKHSWFQVPWDSWPYSARSHDSGSPESVNSYRWWWWLYIYKGQNWLDSKEIWLT